MKLYIGRISEIHFTGSPDLNTPYSYVVKSLDLVKESRERDGFLSDSGMRTGFGLTMEEMEEILRWQLDIFLKDRLGSDYVPRHFNFVYKYGISGEGDDDGLFSPVLSMAGTRVEVAG